MKNKLPLLVLTLLTLQASAQWNWKNVDSLYQPLPKSVHVYMTTDLSDGKPNIAYYVVADLKEKSIEFTTQVGNGKRYTPSEYYEKGGRPTLVMNCTFFEFVHNSNLNVVMKDGKMIAYQQQTLIGKGKDTLTYRHPFGSALGIAKNRKADVAWIYTDSTRKYPYAIQSPVSVRRDSIAHPTYAQFMASAGFEASGHKGGLTPAIKKWKMQTAVGGGPVLLQNGEIKITNNEEIKFAGKAIDDKHPRTAMGYTQDGKLIMLVVQGRSPNKAEGATLTQEARMLKQLGCIEALNLDGGGSSTLLVNGKPTITPSDKEGQRPVPAVFMIRGR